MDVDQLRRELREKELRPVYLLCGPETLLIEEALRTLIETLLAPEERDLGVVRLYADQAEVEEVLGEARTMPLFGPRRLVVLGGGTYFPEFCLKAHAFAVLVDQLGV